MVRFWLNRQRLGAAWLLLAALPMSGLSATITVGVAQTRLEPTLAENRDKVLRFIADAKAHGCRVVVFPETAVASPPDTPPGAITTAFEAIRQAADAHDIYVLCCGPNHWSPGDRRNERLYVFGPEGQTLLTYDKLWFDPRYDALPHTFLIDGVPCAATICADRWLRGVEDLPAICGARILFECSNNYADEWSPDLQWYWTAPRAARNQIYVVLANTAEENRSAGRPGHGHSAVIDPDGQVVVAAGTESDRLLIATLDTTRATGGRADERRHHPVFRPFWDVGQVLRDGGFVTMPKIERLQSPAARLTLAAAQMPCSRSIAANVARMKQLIHDAKSRGADVVAFPELAVTGSRTEDIRRAAPAELAAALQELRSAAKAEKIAVAFGMPLWESGHRYNGAVVIGPEGELLTQYAQLASDRPELFRPGGSAKSLWFTLQGVPGIVTVGRDAQWGEIAELAAIRGAQWHLHLAYDPAMGPAGALARRQRWAVLSSYRMMTVTVNAADPTGLPDPSGPADGGSAIWDDVHREQARQLAKKPGGGFFPYSAVRVAEADSAPTLLTATQTVGGENPHFSRVTRKTHPRMIPWYLSGAAVIAADNVWRPLPLIESGRVSADWQQMGWGGFVVDGDAIRTECDERGMGLLLYTKERFGNAQIRVVYKTKDAKSNSGVFIRLDDGVLARVGDKSPPVRREPNGKLSKAMLDILKESSEKELGAWYPVHHGYEVQICDTADARHRTGAIYSLAEAAPSPPAPADGWRTLIVTLDGERVLVDLDGQRLSTWDAQTVSRSQRHWTEPKLDAKRPTVGYIGLQNHDPGDVVWFREISVRPLASSP